MSKCGQLSEKLDS